MTAIIDYWVFINEFTKSEGPDWARRRGLPAHLLFAGFPMIDEMGWQPRVLDPMQLRHIHNEPAWLAIAGPDRNPYYAMENMPLALADTVEAMCAAGLDTLPMPIVVRRADFRGNPADNPWIILEGNKRVVAAAAALRTEIRCLTGEHRDLHRWHYYRDRGRFANWRQDRRDAAYLKRRSA